MLLPYLMFAVCDVPQSSTGFLLFELLYSPQPRGILDIAREIWNGQTSTGKNVVEHVLAMGDRIKKVTPIVREHAEAAQATQSQYYNQQAKPRACHPSDRVLV